MTARSFPGENIQVRFSFAFTLFAIILSALACSSSCRAQQSSSAAENSAAPPDAPTPASQSAAPQSAQPNAQQTQQQKAEQQVKEEEHQRVVGIVPAFNVTYRSDAVSLSARQKFQLQFRADIDPYVFGLALFAAGLDEVRDADRAFGWGPSGYAKRAAAAYGNNVIGHTFGNAILPSILHQDPRYFRVGHGPIRHRILFPIESTVVCKHDITGKREPDYSNIGGNMIGGAISNLYYPSQNRSSAGHTVVTGLTVTFEGALGSQVQEFWPDISRRIFHKDPTHGLDAQARAADAAKKKKPQEDEQMSH